MKPRRRHEAVLLDRADRQAPFGRLVLVAGPSGLCAISFGPRWEADRHGLERRFGSVRWGAGGAAEQAACAVDAYLAGEWGALDGLPVDPGGTPFQQAVWEELRRIPAGTAVSYGELARRLDRPGAVRAVGAANGRNPVPLVIPCHRVIGADGSLTGYGGGLEIKRWLLAHEARAPGATSRPARGSRPGGPRLPFGA